MTTGKLSFLAFIIVIFASCSNGGKLEGKWQYAGGTYNGKQEGGTEGYQLQRNYTSKNFEAFMIEGGSEPQKYQAGNYTLNGDSCMEIETYSTEPSKLTGVPIHYHYEIKGDTLIFTGKLPTGIQVEERWAKIK